MDQYPQRHSGMEQQYPYQEHQGYQEQGYDHQGYQPADNQGYQTENQGYPSDNQGYNPSEHPGYQAEHQGYQAEHQGYQGEGYQGDPATPGADAIPPPAVPRDYDVEGQEGTKTATGVVMTVEEKEGKLWPVSTFLACLLEFRQMFFLYYCV
jgi:hypothetical protein